MNFKISAICILVAVVLFLTFFLFGSFSATIFHLILCGLLSLGRRDVRYDALLTYNIGAIFAIFIYIYWSVDFGSGYYLGHFSDDWKYDVFWSEEYYKTYGINPIYLNQCFPLHNSRGYVYFVVLLRWFGECFDGYHTFIARFANVFFLTLVSVYAFRLMKWSSCQNKMAYVCFYSVFFFPVNVFLSVHVFRDTLVALIIVAFLYSVINLKDKKIYIGLVVSSLCMMLTLRVGSFIVLLGSLPILLAQPRRSKRYIVFFSPIVIAVLVFYFSSELQYIISSTSRYDLLNIDRRGDIGGKIFALPTIIGFIPRMLYFLFTPVPKFSSFYQFFTSISAILQVLFFPFLFLSLKEKFINYKFRFYFFCFFMAVALTTATFRHVTQYLPLGIVLVCIFVDKNGLKFNRRYLATLFSLLIAFILSILLALWW